MSSDGETESNLPRKVILRSADGEEFEVDVKAAMQSETIKNIIENGCFSDGIPLPNVPGNVLAKVVVFFNHHVGTHKRKGKDAEGSAEDLEKFDREFVNLDKQNLFDLILAANYLSASKLLDVACQAVADTIKYMTVEQVRDYFGIENDFTPEEEEKVRRENQWAFD